MSHEAATTPPPRAGGRQLTAAHIAARALLSASTMDEAIPRILEAICLDLGWEHGARWSADPATGLLHCAESWHTPTANVSAFQALSHRIAFKAGEGLPGRVWSSGEPAWIPDVTQDGNFPRARVATEVGLHAAFGFPILVRGEVLGVLEFFSREIRQPDEELLAMLSTVGHEIGMFLDRRRAEDELDRFFRLSLDMLAIAGFDGYFKRVNPAWQRQLGYTEEELLSKPYMEFVHPDDRQPTIDAASALNRGAEVVHFENRYFHKDGTLRWMLWAAAPFPARQLVYAVAHDITERKATEETLAHYARDLELSHRALADQASRLQQLVKELELAKQLAEEATETKSAFLANMSHEIRTPLNAVLGMAALALDTKVTSQQREYLDTIKTSGEALLRVINDILDFSKIEARRLELERTEFDLREVVGDAVRLLAVRASEKHLELAIDIAADVPWLLVGDPGRLRQVLLNVVGNAIKFTDQGEVVIRVTVDDDETEDGGVRLRFGVRDTGIGIPGELHQKIFQAFTQADSSTTRRYGGTGLGLAISRRLVELMHGRLWVESDVGRGSTFHFTAAFAVPDVAVPVEVIQPRSLAGLRVLVVDDNATNRRILEEMLASWRMSATSVADADTALETLIAALDTEPFDAVISDYQMPDVDGAMFAKRVRKDKRLRDLPFIILTSMGDAGDGERARRLGISAYLAKPVKHSDLLDTLMTLLGQPDAADAPRRKRRARRAPPPLPAGGALPIGRAARTLRVLVAEDNAVNQKLVQTLLERRGHRVTIVQTGREAVDAALGQRPDVLLMDLQMPELGGLDATREIRGRQGDAPRLPIIALTAHAMAGDRQRCLDAGMDDYLSKPIDAAQLIATVERAAGDTFAAPLEPDAASGTDRIFDEAAALAHTGGDRTLLRQIARMFRTDAATTLRTLDAAAARGDSDGVRMSAHSLKGLCATLGGIRARRSAADIETAARKGGTTPPDQVRTIRERVDELDAALVAAGLLAPARSRPRL